MRDLSAAKGVFFSAIAFSMLAGCGNGGAGTIEGVPSRQLTSSGNSAIESVAGGAWGSGSPRLLAGPDAAKGGVFVSTYFGNAVYVYNGSGKLAGTLTGFTEPSGLATDGSGNLYVADTGNSRVQIYAPPYNGTPKSLNDGLQQPEDVAVDAQGNVAVANTEGDGSHPATIAFYAKGSTTPTSTISSPSFAYIDFCAFDKAGNLYLDGFGTSALVGEVVGGISGTLISPLSTSNKIGYAGGVQVTKSGLIAILDSKQRKIFSYNPPVGGNLRSPVETTLLSGTNNPLGMAFTPDNEFAAVADMNRGVAGAYEFPAGGAAVASVALPRYSFPFGIAVVPTEQY